MERPRRGVAFRQGPSVTGMGHAFARARELWEQLGSPSQFVHIPYGQSRHHAFRGEFDLAQRLDEDLLQLSRQRNDSAGMVLGHDCSGRDLLLAGRFASARAHFEEVLAVYDPTAHGSLVHSGSYPQVIHRAIWQSHFSVSAFRIGHWRRVTRRSRRRGG